jgi:hypothetical protein
MIREFSVHPPTNRHVVPRPGFSFGIRGIAILALTSIVCAGCGPFGYLKKVANDANRAVAEAEAAGAEEYAPYEYWGAVAYLEQAKVLMGYSEYERSFDFGERSKQLANEAKIKAQRVKKGESVVHDESVAAPSDMVDAEGKQIESVDEVQREDAGEEKDGANTGNAKDAKPAEKPAAKKGGET